MPDPVTQLDLALLCVWIAGCIVIGVAIDWIGGAIRGRR